MRDVNKLIYGKNNAENIVSVEVEDSVATIFTEKNGVVESYQTDNNFWILSSSKPANDWIRLKGDLHYKWGYQYSTEEDFRDSRRSLRKKDTYSVANSKESFMIKDGYTYFKGMKHNEVSVLSFDIEATTLDHNSEARVLLISNTYRNGSKVIRKLFSYEDYKDEGEMLVDWCSWVRKVDPSLIIGHNILGYDLPYMDFIASRHGVTLDLGRNGSELRFNAYESKFRKDASQYYHYKKAYVYGRELIDTLFLSIKYDVGRKYESYGLKSIIAHEELEVTGRQHYDASQIRHNYKDPVEWEKIKQYALHDADDSLALYDLMSPPFFYLTQSVPKPYQLMIESASGSQINTVMVRSYLQNGHSIPKATESADYEGAISFGNPGIYSNVFKVDVASLYPSIMLEYNVYDKDKDPNRHFFELVKTFTERRLKHKKLAKTDKYYDDLQSAEKIFINSCYGFLGARGLNFNAPDKAAFITKKGREILNKAKDWAEFNGFSIVNADTDSISFTKKDESHMDEAERVSILDRININSPDMIVWEDDGYYPKFIVVKAKNYILFDGVKLKYKGSAIKATTKEPALQQFIKDIIDEIIKGTEEYVLIYDKYVKEILELNNIKRWATRKTITEKVLNPKRTNEQKVLDAISESEYTEGDRAYFFFMPDDSLCLIENFTGEYNKIKLLEKLYKTSNIFHTIIPKELFVNYKLKRNQKELDKFLDKSDGLGYNDLEVKNGSN